MVTPVAGESMCRLSYGKWFVTNRWNVLSITVCPYHIRIARQSAGLRSAPSGRRTRLRQFASPAQPVLKTGCCTNQKRSYMQSSIPTEPVLRMKPRHSFSSIHLQCLNYSTSTPLIRADSSPVSGMTRHFCPSTTSVWTFTALSCGMRTSMTVPVSHGTSSSSASAAFAA